ncbi:hypothetical protein JK358_35955 [Nocardia sp. 2]|uniref:Secreted protein n=1 Tax=Nocardia acididurans TaxID=2802282 RepID=A0ABS1MGY9_9NOCA|nr:hypothetical protein [Nocardia acididurans]MBL1079811.1 hypothetical protein [Nocardia acididurans]
MSTRHSWSTRIAVRIVTIAALAVTPLAPLAIPATATPDIEVSHDQIDGPRGVPGSRPDGPRRPDHRLPPEPPMDYLSPPSFWLMPCPPDYWHGWRPAPPRCTGSFGSC